MSVFIALLNHPKHTIRWLKSIEHTGGGLSTQTYTRIVTSSHNSMDGELNDTPTPVYLGMVPAAHLQEVWLAVANSRAKAQGFWERVRSSRLSDVSEM